MFQSLPPTKTRTNAAGRKAIPIYRVISANPRKRDDVISKGRVGCITYMDKKIILERESVMKSGSDHAHACTFKSGADDKKKNAAQILAVKFRFVAKYTANVTRPALTPKIMEFSKREA